MNKKKKVGASWLQIVMIVLLVGAAFAIGSMWTELRSLKTKGLKTGQQANQPQEQPKEKTALTNDEWQEILRQPAAEKGSNEAKVTIVEFTDYQCPFCGRFFNDAYKQIMSQYVETGKVKYVVRDLPLSFHQNAQKAAEAARCAGDQDNYWQMHDKIFEGQENWGEKANSSDEFTIYAGQLGLNMAKFNTCLSSEQKVDVIKKDMNLAQKLGVSGTPSFFINGKLLVGAQPFTAFQQVIEEELGK